MLYLYPLLMNFPIPFPPAGSEVQPTSVTTTTTQRVNQS